MFPIPWNFPFRKKNGNLVNIGDAIDAGTEIPEHDEGDAGKVLSVDETGNLEWSDEVNSEIQTLEDKLDDEIETRAKLTVHNLLPHIIYTDTSNDVHFSIDEDGIVTLYTEAGGASGDTSFSVSSSGERNLTYETGNYYLSGCPSDGENNIAVKLNPRDGSNVYDYGNSVLISLSSTDIYKVEVWIKSGTIITTPIIFKPMITSETDARHSYDDFTPYAMTNRELTEKAIIKNVSGYSWDSAIDGSTDIIVKRYGAIVSVYGYFISTNALTQYANILSGLPHCASGAAKSADVVHNMGMTLLNVGTTSKIIVDSATIANIQYAFNFVYLTDN